MDAPDNQENQFSFFSSTGLNDHDDYSDVDPNYHPEHFIFNRPTREAIKQAAKHILEVSPNKEELSKHITIIKTFSPLRIGEETMKDLKSAGIHLISLPIPRGFRSLLSVLTEQLSKHTGQEPDEQEHFLSSGTKSFNSSLSEDFKDLMDIKDPAALAKSLETAFAKHADPIDSYSTIQEPPKKAEAEALKHAFNSFCKLTPTLELYNEVMASTEINFPDYPTIADNLFNDAVTCCISLRLTQAHSEALIKRDGQTSGAGPQYGITVEVQEIEPTADLKITSFSDIRGAITGEATCNNGGVIYNGTVALKVFVKRSLL